MWWLDRQSSVAWTWVYTRDCKFENYNCKNIFELFVLVCFHTIFQLQQQQTHHNKKSLNSSLQNFLFSFVCLTLKNIRNVAIHVCCRLLHWKIMNESLGSIVDRCFLATFSDCWKRTNLKFKRFRKSVWTRRTTSHPSSQISQSVRWTNH